jgi:hypothetical protein
MPVATDGAAGGVNGRLAARMAVDQGAHFVTRAATAGKIAVLPEGR